MPESEKYCFVGPMIGRKPGHVTTQGQVLSELFQKEGYDLLAVSDSLSRFGRLAEIIRVLINKNNHFKLVHLEVFGGRSFVVEDIVSRLSRFRKFPIIMTLHGGNMPEFMAKFPNWTRSVLGRADAVVTPSIYLAKAAAPYGIQARVIPNVLDLDSYGFRIREHIKPELFWMRTFHPIWNPLMALKVLFNLKKKFPEIKLTMAGQDKGMLKECVKFAEENGLSSSVSFPGFLNQAQKKAAADRADIFINTNRIDNMPVSVLEACAFGIPVVSTDVGGISDMIRHEETGLLVKDGDDEAMSAMVIRLLENPVLAKKLSQNGRNFAERSSWQTVKVQWEKLFKEVSGCAV